MIVSDSMCQVLVTVMTYIEQYISWSMDTLSTSRSYDWVTSPEQRFGSGERHETGVTWGRVLQEISRAQNRFVRDIFDSFVASVPHNSWNLIIILDCTFSWRSMSGAAIIRPVRTWFIQLCRLQDRIKRAFWAHSVRERLWEKLKKTR